MTKLGRSAPTSIDVTMSNTSVPTPDEVEPQVDGTAAMAGSSSSRLKGPETRNAAPDGWFTRRRIGTAVAATVVGLLVWSVAVEPRHVLDVQHEEAVINELPSSWEGEQFGVIGDLQIGLWFDNVGMARRAVDRLIEEAPAVSPGW